MPTATRPRLAAALLALAAPAASAAAQRALATSSDGSNGAYCVSTSASGASADTCTTSHNVFSSRWSASDRPSGRVVVRKPDGTCLDASGGPRQSVRTLRCNDGAAQNWTLHTTGQIESQLHGGQCLNVSGGLGAGRAVVLWPCTYGPDAGRPANERFFFGTAQRVPARTPATRATLGSVLSAGATLSRAGVLSLVGNNGNTLIGVDGATIVAAGAGNIVAAGAGN